MLKVAMLTITLLIQTGAGQGNASSANDKSSFTGTWSCKMYGVQAVTLTVKQEQEKLGGTVLFYLIRHNDGKPARSSPGTPEPLIDPRLDGKVLHFQVSHRHAHPPATLNDPPVSFTFQLIENNRAVLKREGGEPDSSCEMTKLM
jgi:hypothetical protein